MYTKETNLLLLEEKFFSSLKTKGRSSNTLKNYRTDLQCFNNFLIDHQNKLSLEKFDLPQVTEYSRYLDKKYDSSNSRRRRVQALRLFFDFLVENEVFPQNPIKKLPTSPKFVDIPRPVSFNDLSKLWQHLLNQIQNEKGIQKLKHTRNLILIHLIFHSGLKVSQLAKLKRKHIIQGDNDDRILVAPPRRDPYSIRVSKDLSALLGFYYNQLDSIQKLNQKDFDEILFNANAHKILSGGLSPRGIELIFEEFRKSLKIEITAKSLRQACILNWLHSGVEDVTIIEWLGFAPSYSLGPYKSEMDQHFYNAETLSRQFEQTL